MQCKLLLEKRKLSLFFLSGNVSKPASVGATVSIFPGLCTYTSTNTRKDSLKENGLLILSHAKPWEIPGKLSPNNPYTHKTINFITFMFDINT